jgi:hypothetical protein
MADVTEQTADLEQQLAAQYAYDSRAVNSPVFDAQGRQSARLAAAVSFDA